MIGVVVQSEQGNIRNRMFPMGYTIPFASLFGNICSFVQHRMLPCSAPYAPLFGTVSSLVRHRAFKVVLIWIH